MLKKNLRSVSHLTVKLCENVKNMIKYHNKQFFHPLSFNMEILNILILEISVYIISKYFYYFCRVISLFHFFIFTFKFYFLSFSTFCITSIFSLSASSGYFPWFFHLTSALANIIGIYLYFKQLASHYFCLHFNSFCIFFCCWMYLIIFVFDSAVLSSFSLSSQLIFSE